MEKPKTQNLRLRPRTTDGQEKFKTNPRSKISKHKRFGFPPRGITLLLVILVLASLLSISIGIFTSVITELRLSGEIADSFVALYAADEAIERGLYLDLNQPAPLCPGLVFGLNCYDSGTVSLANGSCYRFRVDKVPVGMSNFSGMTIRATGEFRCGAAGPFGSVKRALRVDYTTFR